MLELTQNAQAAIRAMIEESELGEGAGLRISGETDPGGEVTLDFELAEAPADGDEVLRSGEAIVFLDELAVDVLSDQTLDVEEHGDHVHFSLDEQSS